MRENAEYSASKDAAFMALMQIEPLARRDRRFVHELPAGGLVVDVFTKITDARWPTAKDKWEESYFAMFRASTGRDHLWITDGHVAAGKGDVVMEFDQNGKLLRTLGKPGVSGAGPDTFHEPNAVLIARRA